jgi:riboflavin biosynthesis pyrimidine reductase
MVTIRQLLPKPASDVDAYQAYRPADPHARLVRINMVTSADGCVLDADGRSGSIGADGDREIFRCLRALADAIVVGRAPHGRRGTGRTACLPGWRLHGPPTGVPLPLPSSWSRPPPTSTTEPAVHRGLVPTVVVTCAAAPPRTRPRRRQAGRLLVAGETPCPPQELVHLLREELGLEHLLVEGGPSLNAGLLDAGLVDELCVTVAPALLGGRDPGSRERWRSGSASSSPPSTRAGARSSRVTQSARFVR